MMLLYGYCRLILIGVQLFLPLWCLLAVIYTLIEIGVYISKIIYVRRRSRKDSIDQFRLVRYQKRSKQEFAQNHPSYNDYYNRKEIEKTRKNSCPESSNISINIRSNNTKNNEIFSSYSSSRRIMEKMQLKSSINQSAEEKPTENISESNSSIAIPTTLKKGISYRRNLLIYNSLGTRIQTEPIPAHLPALEERNRDKKLEEKRLEWLLSGVKQACKKKDCTKSGIYCGSQQGLVRYQEGSKQEFAQYQKVDLNYSNCNDYYNQKQIDKKKKRT
ncbi:uncharacterized protein LOC111631079 [Centruroides sculpturatus]|uniref:uncharacterized protein LOC111631079 n=1 Tax=Centruroides sculpturatus TaxID=218467 RepID=UPI000C6EEA1B|nr:uncharacterized protein LOC111631079 [Centruroides sculpturatus]